MNTHQFIRERVPKEELLAQLAEEATELAHLVRYGSWRVQRKNLVRLRKIFKRNNS